jgi:nucleoid-associated protein YgaU
MRNGKSMYTSGSIGRLAGRWRSVILCGLALISLSALKTSAQDAAEAAGQEKARKPEPQKTPRHVYSEQDLQRRRILTPEDQSRVEARKRQQNAEPEDQNAKQAPNDMTPQDESLGEIARRYRQEKAARETDLAVRKKLTPFPYVIPDNSLAAPAPGVAPLAGFGVGSEVKGGLGLVAPVRPPEKHGRISPFQPRPLSGVSAIAPSEVVGVPPPVAPVVRPTNPVQPMAKSVVPGATVPGMKRIEVQRGQSWWKLAEIYLGNGMRWPELRALNEGTDEAPELLRAGSTVVVPEATKVEPGSTPGTIEVRKGDSLWSLAHEYFGRGSAWSCLASANPQIVDYTHLMVGAVLQMPLDSGLQACQNRSGALK